VTYHYVFNEGKSDKEALLVLFHGTGGDEYDLLPVAERIAPNAAVLSLRGNRSEHGMNRFFNRTADGRVDAADMIRETATLHQFLTDFIQKNELSKRSVIAVGFSNGANLIISYLHHPESVFKGAMLFHGMDYRPDEPFPDLIGTSLFVAAGVNDPLVPEHESKKLVEGFKKQRADVVVHWSASGHALTDEEIHAARKWARSFDSGHNEMRTLLKEINRLALQSRERALTQDELILQRNLREQYLHIFRDGFRQHLLNIKLIDRKGQDRTPEKVKAIQSNLDRSQDKKIAGKVRAKIWEAKAMSQLLGLHHVSMVTSDAKKNVAFYTQVLGMRLVKKSVNQDDISVYHLYFADQKGSPGTTLTFFEFPGTAATRKGTNAISRVSLRVASDAALAFWARRLEEQKVVHDDINTLFGHKVLEFEDFDGTPLRLVSDEKDTGVAGGIPWEKGTVPAAFAIRGLGPVTLTVSRLESAIAFLNGVLHFRQVAMEKGLLLFEVGEGGHGAQVIIREDTSHAAERPGYGSVHHVAFRVADRAALNSWIDVLSQTGLPNSGFVDRYYFQSVYLREYNHILFELATDGPGFAVDEDEDALGKTLALPPFLENKRALIEDQLTPLES
jgi:Predicted esterase